MELFDRIVTETVQSGIEPFQLTFTGIHDCYTGMPVAYRTETDVFCSATGKLSGSYVQKIDLTETGKDLMPALTALIAWGKKHFNDVVTD